MNRNKIPWYVFPNMLSGLLLTAIAMAQFIDLEGGVRVWWLVTTIILGSYLTMLAATWSKPND